MCPRGPRRDAGVSDREADRWREERWPLWCRHSRQPWMFPTWAEGDAPARWRKEKSLEMESPQFSLSIMVSIKLQIRSCAYKSPPPPLSIILLFLPGRLQSPGSLLICPRPWIRSSESFRLLDWLLLMRSRNWRLNWQWYWCCGSRSGLKPLISDYQMSTQRFGRRGGDLLSGVEVMDKSKQESWKWDINKVKFFFSAIWCLCSYQHGHETSGRGKRFDVICANSCSHTDLWTEPSESINGHEWGIIHVLNMLIYLCTRSLFVYLF